MRLVGTAASGIRAQQVTIDTIGNNIANANTLGYKANQINFSEALSAEVRSETAITAGDPRVAAALDVGVGVLYNSGGTNFKQGNLAQTDRPLDLGINGAGFFQVTLDGRIGYTRAGAFQVDGSGQLTDMQGDTILPNVVIPSGAVELSVASNGVITGVVGGVKTVLGQISLAGFQNPSGLERIGDNLFVPTVNSGAPQVGQPGSTTAGNQVLGTIRAQSLEQSNVDLATSTTELIQVQRAYQMNARLVQDGDKMWGIANTMRR